MKNIVVILSFLLLLGCGGNSISDMIYAPPKMIKNSQCENIAAIKIFQVLDDFALARTCLKYNCRDVYFENNYIVSLPKEKNQIYYDDQIIKTEKGKCASYFGTYEYESEDEKDRIRIRTVPKIKYIDKKIENPEYQKYQEEKELKNKKGV